MSYQCDMALAGGVSLKIPLRTGYLFKEGHILSPDGRCRAFDGNANGTVWGEGVGIVVLKRLEEAAKDHDTIHAIIKSTALNNDGSGKVGFTAPSVDGQATVIALAHALAGVEPRGISYVEAHGTGTQMGDPIEVAGLTKAFTCDSADKNYCALGSVKTNIGHLDAAAGAAGLIKTALALKHGLIPPTLHFSQPNPHLHIEQSPFFVNTTLLPWKSASSPRRAGVSSFGIGGTNAHAVLEEAPASAAAPSSKTWHILPLSARSENALECATENMAAFLKNDDIPDIADIAHTLQVGRRAFAHRRVVVCRTAKEAAEAMDSHDADRVHSGAFSGTVPSIVFMFSGQGSQYVNMSKELYKNSPVYRDRVDYCSAIISPLLGIDLSGLLFPLEADRESATSLLSQTAYTQPALFVLEYSLACLFMSWGVRPDAMIGHSIGEYVAACLSGVFGLDETLRLIVDRAKIMQQQPPGVMLSVSAPEEQIKNYLEHDVGIALINGPRLCVVGGSADAIDLLESSLTSDNIQHRRLHTSHAFHTFLMNGAVERFAQCVSETTRHAPSIPFISNVSGTWITADQALDPLYWASHIRSTVQFSSGVKQLLINPNTIFVEIGPGNTLCTLVSLQATVDGSETVVQTLAHAQQQRPDMELFLNAIGLLWIAGARIDWNQWYGDEPRYRTSLPTYPFERQRYWVEPGFVANTTDAIQSSLGKSKIENANTSQTALHRLRKHSFHPRPNLANEYRAPTNDIERQLVEIWQRILGFEPIGIQDNFIGLGGHSLLAVQMFFQIQKTTGLNLPLATLFTAPTIEKLASILGEKGALSENRAQEGITRSSQETYEKIPQRDGHESPLSLSQQRIWFIVQVDPASPAFNLTWTLEINGPIDAQRLEQAFQKVCDRHRILKTVFPLRSGMPLAVYDQEFKIPFSAIAPIASWEAMAAEVRVKSIEPFSLEKGPLVRGELYTFGPTRGALIVYLHHIITDGWSMGVFLKHLTQAYNEPDTPLSRGPQFFDYVAWNAAEMERKDLGPHRAFWKERLSGALPLLTMSSDRPRPSKATFHGGSAPVSLPRELTGAIKAFARSEGVTVFAAIMAGFKLLLNIFSENQQDLIVGTPYANRTHPDTEEMMGFFLTILPIRTTLRPGSTFTEYVHEVAGRTIEAFRFGDLPFEQIIQIVNPARDFSYTPLFQVMLAFQNFPLEPASAGQATLCPKFIDRGAAEYDLSLYLWENEGVFDGVMEYSSDLFSEATVSVMIETFKAVLQAAVDSPRAKLGDLRRLSAEGFNRYVIGWNQTQAPCPNLCVHDLFSEQARKTPEAVACSDGAAALTYRMLDEQSGRLAAYLQEKSAGPGTLVGICMSRTVDMVVGLFAVLKAGAAYVPLDPSFPRERLDFMVRDAGITIVISDNAAKGDLPDGKMTVISADGDHDAIASAGRALKKPSVNHGNTAYVIYTSGSTGKPKGVCITHGSVVNFLAGMAIKPGVSKNDVVCAVTTLSFDIAVLELVLPLTVGGRIEIADRETAGDGNLLKKLIASKGITLMQGTPATWRLLIAAGWQGNPHMKVLCGGEALSPELAEALLPRCKELWNMYGPTETTVWSSCARIVDAKQCITLGNPIANTAFYIANESGTPLPPMAPGELLISGKGLSCGYLNRPDLTQKNFIPNTIHPGHGPLMYRTGDLARMRSDGTLEYLHRIDTQVKVRGFRIELGEIETVAAKYPAIKQCVAVVVGANDDVRLALYYVLEKGTAATQTELRKHLRTDLPDYMLPHYFVELEFLPLTPNGKIDRKALPAPMAQTVASAIGRLPESPEEFYLAGKWKKILNVASVHKEDNFFDLGGHSLLCMQLISDIEKEKGVRLTPRLFLLNTLEQIGVAYQREREKEQAPSGAAREKRKIAFWKK
jgi:amino acid adenylation domain-containing protein